MRRKIMKQMLRQSRIKNNSLIVGIDVGKWFHSVALCSPNGRLLRLLKKVKNSRKDFDHLLKNIREIGQKDNLCHVIVGFEPTGPWWQPLASFLGGFGFELVFVRPGAVKEFSRLAEGSNSKSDTKDAIKIANLVRFGHFLDGPVLTNGPYKDMRVLSSHRAAVQKDLNSSLNRLGSLLGVYFPELCDLFSSLGRKSLLALLEHYPLPVDILAAAQKEISNFIKRASNNRLGDKRAQAIYGAAQSSIGAKEGHLAARFKIKDLVATIRYHQGRKKNLDKQLIELAKSSPHFSALVSLPGVGPLSAALFLGALGDPARFKNSREIVSYAGMEPLERQSGMWQSPSFISKQGRHDLRHIVYLMALRCIKSYEPLRSFYTRKSSGVSKKKALCAASNKLVRILFAKLNGRPCGGQLSRGKIASAA